MLGPNSLCMFNARCKWFASFSTMFESGWPLDGGVSIVSQSGAFGSHLSTLARNAGIGVLLCVMTGNEADISVGEVIGCLAADPKTKVTAAYMEGVKNGKTLMAGLAAARDAGKPVLIMKDGRSQLGAQAAASHTASIAGDEDRTPAEASLTLPARSGARHGQLLHQQGDRAGDGHFTPHGGSVPTHDQTEARRAQACRAHSQIAGRIVAGAIRRK